MRRRDVSFAAARSSTTTPTSSTTYYDHDDSVNDDSTTNLSGTISVDDYIDGVTTTESMEMLLEVESRTRGFLVPNAVAAAMVDDEVADEHHHHHRPPVSNVRLNNDSSSDMPSYHNNYSHNQQQQQLNMQHRYLSTDTIDENMEFHQYIDQNSNNDINNNNNNSNNNSNNSTSNNNGVIIVKNIASFLSLSDAESIASLSHSNTSHHGGRQQHSHHNPLFPSSRSRGGTNGGSSASLCRAVSSFSTLETPATPGVMALSPIPLPDDLRDDYYYQQQQRHDHHGDNNNNKEEEDQQPGLIEAESDYDDDDYDEYDYDDDGKNGSYENDDDYDEEESIDSVQKRLQERRKRWIQEKLTAAIFSHPQSLRSYCLEAHQKASDISRNRMEQQHQQQQHNLHHQQHQQNDTEEQIHRHHGTSEASLDDLDPETLREAPEINDALIQAERRRRRRIRIRKKRKEKEQRLRIIRHLIKALFHNVPLSVLFDLMGCSLDLSLDTSYALFHISTATVNCIISALCNIIHAAWNIICKLNPFALIETIISMQFNAVGKTSEVLVSGIQSVATGVGSTSTAVFQRFSRGTVGHYSTSTKGTEDDSGVLGKIGLRRGGRSTDMLNAKLLRKLSSINSAARVVSYRERSEDQTITRYQKKRVQRMMHYEVSLRPFEATVVLPSEDKSRSSQENASTGVNRRQSSSNNVGDDANRHTPPPPSVASVTSPPDSPLGSPLMCTPKSFPPTPASRSLVMARGVAFSEDVIFLARDQLRVEDALRSSNEKTRAMASELRKGSRLAVFNAADVSNGIVLSCGQHMATKVGNVLYGSTRSMIPVLRNSFVYFEISVMAPPMGNAFLQASLATLAIGLSTLEMPLNTLVGAWKGSVGLCTTGQILTSGQWCSPSDPSLSSYGDNATVGCLACLDDGSAFETWDGVMVTAAITFNVNGTVVSPPVCTVPMANGSDTQTDANGEPVNGPANMQPSQQPTKLPGPISTLPLLVPMDEELYPTVTLHSQSTQVMCRFSAQDILAETRESIGAPKGVAVHAVDGSVILDEDETFVSGQRSPTQNSRKIN